MLSLRIVLLSEIFAFDVLKCCVYVCVRACTCNQTLNWQKISFKSENFFPMYSIGRGITKSNDGGKPSLSPRSPFVPSLPRFTPSSLFLCHSQQSTRNEPFKSNKLILRAIAKRKLEVNAEKIGQNLYFKRKKCDVDSFGFKVSLFEIFSYFFCFFFLLHKIAYPL